MQDRYIHRERQGEREIRSVERNMESDQEKTIIAIVAPSCWLDFTKQHFHMDFLAVNGIERERGWEVGGRQASDHSWTSS